MLPKVFPTIGLLVLTIGLSLHPAFAQGAGDAAKGKTLWEGNSCKRCYGDNGEGKYAGPRAGDGKKAADWIKQVRTPRQNMPAFSSTQVSDADLTDMWAYMQTLMKPASFAPIMYPPADGDMPGKVLFSQKRCVACHGDGKGLVKTRLTDKGRPLTAADVIKSLRMPVKMPSYSVNQVSDAEGKQIVEYLLR